MNYFAAEHREAWAAFLRAILAAPEDGVRGHVDATILKGDRRWISIDPEALGEMIAKLGGLASTARHLSVVPMTVQNWVKRSRIPSWALTRMNELIAAGAPSRRRGRTRHTAER